MVEWELEMPSPVKEMMFREIAREFEANPYAFLSRFDGLPVADLSELRRSLEKVARRSLVVKHAMVKKVFSQLKIAEAQKFLKGSVLVTLGDKEPQVISKALVEFAKTHEKLVVSGAVMDRKVYEPEFVNRLAKLPSRQELLTQVVVRVKSPISGFVMTLNQLLRGLVVALDEIKKKKFFKEA